MEKLPQPLLICQNDQLIFFNKASNNMFCQILRSSEELREKFNNQIDFEKSNEFLRLKILAKRGSPEKDYNLQEILMLTPLEVSDLTLKIIRPDGILVPDNKCCFSLKVSDNILINNQKCRII